MNDQNTNKVYERLLDLDNRINSVLEYVRVENEKYNNIMRSIVVEVRALKASNTIHNKHEDKYEHVIEDINKKVEDLRLTLNSMSSQINYNVKTIQELKDQCNDHYNELNAIAKSLNEKEISIIKLNDKIKAVFKQYSNLTKDINSICSRLDAIESTQTDILTKYNQGVGAGTAIWKLGAIVAGAITLALTIKQLFFG